MSSAFRPVSIAVALVVEIALLVGIGSALGLFRPGAGTSDYIDIADAPLRSETRVAGVYTFDCGRNDEGHRNTANVVVAPGTAGPEHHVHDYVGNLSTDVTSTDASLAAAETSCANGDLSTYYWPVLRVGSGPDHGRIVTASRIVLEYRGNPAGPVVAAPVGLRAMVGDARAGTTDSGLAAATWTCGDRLDRRTDRYPRCHEGDEVLRVFDFPSCWDGRRTDSSGHRQQLTFPGPEGACPRGTFAVPQLRITVAYRLAPDAPYTIDAFPDQGRSPRTDHAIMINLMPEPLMRTVVGCVNEGRSCA